MGLGTGVYNTFMYKLVVPDVESLLCLLFCRYVSNELKKKRKKEKNRNESYVGIINPETIMSVF